ncbi:hypothetical protein THASP1DRAFT_28988 [Thamnocephalis sphaerospora]|uniref:F-box domain-containing protein n=1 Tax=Thamnocephalis sphaerospora TaxID=78915 RepID=A0A4P9XST2_9FUNG|nr:hypothetical protein THASP1DRAFT_28988 [Thamnocephalis sphaerospora]|eukprot:RKP09215.1 hypothetical protein THASP1DRAFT_28988 [Thamnocephalis sphaerospora]
MPSTALVPAAVAIDHRLPVELLTRILYELTPEAAVALSRVNHTLRRVVRQETGYWRQSYRAHYGGEVCRQGMTWCDNEEIAESMDSEATLRAFLLAGTSDTELAPPLRADWYAAYTARASLALRWQRSTASSPSTETTITPRIHLLGALTPIPGNDDQQPAPYATPNPWRRSMINVHAAYTVVANEQGVWVTPHPRRGAPLPSARMLCRPADNGTSQVGRLPSPPSSPDMVQRKGRLLSSSAGHTHDSDNSNADQPAPTPIEGYNPKRCWSNDRWVVVAGVSDNGRNGQHTVYHVWKGDTGRKILNSGARDELLCASLTPLHSAAEPINAPMHQHAGVLLAGSRLLECAQRMDSTAASDMTLVSQRWALAHSSAADETSPCRDYAFQTPQKLWQASAAATAAQDKRLSLLLALRSSKLRPHLLAGIQIVDAQAGTDTSTDLVSGRRARILFWDLRGPSSSPHPNVRHDLAPFHATVTLAGVHPLDSPTVCLDFTNEALVLHGNALRPSDAQLESEVSPNSARVYHWIACCSFHSSKHCSDCGGVAIAPGGHELWRRTYPAWQGIWSAQPMHAVGLLAVAFGEGDGDCQDPWLAAADRDPVVRQYPLGTNTNEDGLHILSLADGSLVRTFAMRPTRLIDAVGPIVVVTWNNVRHGVAAVDAVAGRVHWRQRFPEDEPHTAGGAALTSTLNSACSAAGETITHGWLDVRVSSTRLLMIERGRRIRRRDNTGTMVRCEERMLVVDFA